MPVEMWKRAKVLAMDDGRDLRDVLLDALSRYLGEPQKEDAR